MRITADDVYSMIVSGDIYVDFYAAPLVDREKVQVFDKQATAELLAQANSTLPGPKAKYVDVTEGARVLWDNKVWEISNVGKDDIWLINGSACSHIPHELFEKYISQEIFELIDPSSETDSYSHGLNILNNAKENVRAEAERRLETIKPYLSGEKRLRGVKRERSIRRYIAAYKEALEFYGIGLVGLLPQWPDRGNTTKRLPEAVYEIMDSRVKNDYETLVQKNMYAVWGSVLNDCETQGIPEDQQPSYETFRNKVQSRPRAEQVRKRKGNRAAYRHETFVFLLEKDTPPQGDRPFEIAHADHTELDVECVCPLTGQNLGRPWASFLVDAYSRRLLAIVVMFDPPSYRSCMMLFRECVRKWGRLPQTVVVDNGPEFRSVYFRRLAATFEITVKMRPKGKPRHGSVCERLFGTANTQVVHNLKGNTQLMREVRQTTQSVNPKKHAAWTLEELSKGLCDWGYQVYDTLPHWTLKQSPRDAFARNLKLTGTRPKRIIYSEPFRIMTMPTTRKGTAKNAVDKGLKINNLYYWCEELRNPEIEGKQLNIRYDPFDISTAYAYIGHRWVKCLSEYHLPFQGCTERQLQIASKELRARNNKFLKGRSISARRLADFLKSLEKVQDKLSENRLLAQRAHDRETRPVFRIINGNYTDDTSVSGSAISQNNATPLSDQPQSSRASINVDEIEPFKELTHGT